MIWKDIVGYEGRYKISDNGDILSLSVKKPIKLRHSGEIVFYNSLECILARSRSKKGYIQYFLSDGVRRKSFYAHVLVAKHFIFNESNLPLVNHIDGNLLNINFKNLEWVNFRENRSHAFKKKGGETGSFFNKKSGKFISSINFLGKTIYLGSFNTSAEANAAYVYFLESKGLQNKYK